LKHKRFINKFNVVFPATEGFPESGFTKKVKHADDKN